MHKRGKRGTYRRNTGGVQEVMQKGSRQDTGGIQVGCRRGAGGCRRDRRGVQEECKRGAGRIQEGCR